MAEPMPTGRKAALPLLAMCLGLALAATPNAAGGGAPEVPTQLAEGEIPPPIFCAGPYQRPATDGEAQWCEFDCADGTVPDEATQECVCAEGLAEIGEDRNRRVCGTLAPAAPD